MRDGVRKVRGGCLLYSGFIFLFFLSFDVVEQLTDCVWAGLKGVMIISGRRSSFCFFSKVNGGTDKAGMIVRGIHCRCACYRQIP